MSVMTAIPIIYCVTKVINKVGMLMTEVRQIKAGINDALGDGIFRLLPGASLIITQDINQNVGIYQG